MQYDQIMLKFFLFQEAIYNYSLHIILPIGMSNYVKTRSLDPPTNWVSRKQWERLHFVQKNGALSQQLHGTFRLSKHLSGARGVQMKTLLAEYTLGHMF